MHSPDDVAALPDLNSDEGIWNYLKRFELKNRDLVDLADLSRELLQAKDRVRHRRDVMQICSVQCGYSA